MIKAIIFDCFGVLVGRGFRETYRLAGGDPKADADFINEQLYQASMGQVSSDEFRLALSGRLNITLNDWDAAVRQAEQLNQPLLEYSQQLRGHYKTAVMSNCNRGVLERKIGQAQLEQAFDTWVASAEIGTVKPDPAIYHYTCEKLAVQPSEAVFIDDNPNYIEAAEGLGMKGVIYKDFADMKQQLQRHLDHS